MILLIFNILLVSAYLALSVYATKGVPVSLSATYYTLGGYGWLFQIIMMFVPISLMIVWLGVTEHQWLAFLSCGSLLFVASTPMYRTYYLQGKVHYGAAILSGVCAVVWQLIEGLWDVTLLFAFVGGMLCLQMRDKGMWWLECAVIGSLFCNLMRVL